MTRKTRAYSSPTREKQAEQTRLRIVDAAIELLGTGASALTIPAVAASAGVAVPTVYRYFRTKEELEDAVVGHVREVAGLFGPMPRSVDGLVALVRSTWLTVDRLPPTYVATMLASVGREMLEPESRSRNAARRRGAAPCLDDALAGTDPVVADKVVRVASALASSPGAVSFLRAGNSAEEAADLYEFLVRALVAHARAGGG